MKGFVWYIVCMHSKATVIPSTHCNVVSCVDIMRVFLCHIRQCGQCMRCDVVSAVRTLHALCNVVSNHADR